jgi:surfeit locus 1 family protein
MPASEPAASTAESAVPASRARRIVVLVAALLTVLVTARLGLWQLDRAAQKEALQSALEHRADEPPLLQGELAATAQQAPAQHHRRTELHGQWLAQATVFLDNRQMNGRPGFFVLTPMRLVDPASQGNAPRLVWVQRGWVPRDNDQRTRLPELPTPAGEVVVRGRVAPAPARLYQFGTEAAGPIRQNLDLEASAAELGPGVLPLTVVQTEAADVADGLQRDWPAPAVDVHKHYGYAFQWFALCALVTGLYVWYQLVRPRRRRVR